MRENDARYVLIGIVLAVVFNVSLAIAWYLS